MGKKQIKSLSQGRPPLLKTSRSLSSKATKSIINRHHNLLKSKLQAENSGDTDTVDRISKEIEKNGGLQKYQLASQTGQLSSRGGDTSKILKTWLDNLKILESVKTLKLLEIGCLSPFNVISACKNMEITRIDLHSSHASILQQDFMERPLPKNDDEKFDIISLSLVLNYVSSPLDRGNMLFRTTQFFETQSLEGKSLPLLFFTLPLPCVANSRYMTISHLEIIMSALNYSLLESKKTTKIYYSLWQYHTTEHIPKVIKKVEISSGYGKNNFSIIVDTTGKND